ncbi:hypothetical protein HDU98_005558 [Podochytrium sp. JEL0797]|nr:hypothetical protein HDU98_005558 [Podochytrium sp. JEL0797]
MPTEPTFSIPIDPSVIHTLEEQSHLLSADLSRLVASLTSRMTAMTSSAHESVVIHHSCVSQLCETVDESRAKMVNLITGVDQLAEDLGAVVALKSQISVLKEAVALIEKRIK